MSKKVDREAVKLYNHLNQLSLHNLRAFAVGYNTWHKIKFIRKMKRGEIITALIEAYTESGDFKKSVDKEIEEVVAKNKYQRIPKTTDTRKKIVVKSSSGGEKVGKLTTDKSPKKYGAKSKTEEVNLDGEEFQIKKGALRRQLKVPKSHTFKRAELLKLSKISKGEKFTFLGKEFKMTTLLKERIVLGANLMKK